MSTISLFDSPAGPVTSESLREALVSVGADQCSVLYIHSGLTFGAPAPGLSRRHLLEQLVDVIRSLGVATLCMPTFTFSFCNGESFDRGESRSSMGVLNEHFRQLPDAERSVDPLMSVAALGADLDLVRNLGIQSIGENSTFDKLAHRDDVKFLFLGVRPGACFTYMHYLEWKARVPYRYDREFVGQVTDNGTTATVTKKLFVRYNGVFASDTSFDYEAKLLDLGHLLEAPVGASTVSCMPRLESENLYLDLLESDPNYFITEPFDIARVDTEFHPPRPMVAL
ncbi:MAG: Aminoglycoside 3-N-acetyltransferase [Ilumatobacteraceae bacterium]|nr:Aminoglycoside 3-N-acetyltransferase [Ilumatobacteraceae bacterium]